jgi:ElaB/YqjD/DUF883 family membrane-anchored ribosome-binding protein
MKTQMQELLNLEADLTQMFDSDERVAMALLEHIRANRKQLLEDEEEQMIDFAVYWRHEDFTRKEITKYYNETYGGNK